MKCWKKFKKDNVENFEYCVNVYEIGFLSGVEELLGIGLVDLFFFDGLGVFIDNFVIYLVG